MCTGVRKVHSTLEAHGKMLLRPGGLVIRVEAATERLKPFDLLLLVVLCALRCDSTFDDCSAGLVEVVAPVTVHFAVVLDQVNARIWLWFFSVRCHLGMLPQFCGV